MVDSLLFELLPLLFTLFCSPSVLAFKQASSCLIVIVPNYVERMALTLRFPADYRFLQFSLLGCYYVDFNCLVKCGIIIIMFSVPRCARKPSVILI